MPSLPSRLYRPLRQTFTFGRNVWDVGALLDDIESRRLHPEQIVLDRAFIEAYAQQALGQARSWSPGQPHLQGFFAMVDVDAALALPAAALTVPVLLLETEAGTGLLTLRTGVTDHLLADGQHRMTKAFYEDCPSMSAYLVGLADAKRYQLVR